MNASNVPKPTRQTIQFFYYHIIVIIHSTLFLYFMESIQFSPFMNNKVMRAYHSTAYVPLAKVVLGWNDADKTYNFSCMIHSVLNPCREVYVFMFQAKYYFFLPF